MTISLDIKLNDFFVTDTLRYRYALELPLNRMLFVSDQPDGGSEFILSEAEFEKRLGNREMRKYEVIRDAEGNIVHESDCMDTDPRHEGSKKENDARSLFFYLKKWHSNPTSKYHSALELFVDRHSKEARALGFNWMPSAGALHRHLNKYPNVEDLTARFLISQSGESKRQRWHPAIAKILEGIIYFHWEENTRNRNLSDSVAEFDRRFADAAKAIANDTAFVGPLKKPSDETVRSYINSAECYETVARKFGKGEADAKFSGNYHPIPAKRLLEVVLIDSTVLDTWCVLDDETMLPLGRPTLTIAIDLYTRMILAAIVTYEPPSLFTAMACLKRVNMSKEDINERWPTILRKSDGWGKPSMVVVDNELAQAGKSYQSACEDGKINVRWAPVARPQYKAVVERFFLTLKMLLLDKLPGGVPYKPDIMRQLGIDPAKVATIPVHKLNELVNMAINDVYHYDPHSTLRMPPALAWEKSKKQHKRPYIGDIEFLDKAFGALETRTLTTSGIEFEGMVFHDPGITGGLLDDLAGLAPRRARRKSKLSSLNPRVMFKYNPANIEAIYVWNGKRKEYVRLPNISREATKGLSIWHWKILRIWTKQESVAFSTPAEQAAARRRLRESVEEMMPAVAYESIKKLRRIIHEPSELVEGKTVRKTQAPPTVGGMASDDVEIEVAAFAPEGNRVPPPGATRGRKKAKKPDKRTKARMKEAKLSDKPAVQTDSKIATTIANITQRMQANSSTPASDRSAIHASLKDVFERQREKL